MYLLFTPYGNLQLSCVPHFSQKATTPKKIAGSKITPRSGICQLSQMKLQTTSQPAIRLPPFLPPPVMCNNQRSLPQPPRSLPKLTCQCLASVHPTESQPITSRSLSPTTVLLSRALSLTWVLIAYPVLVAYLVMGLLVTRITALLASPCPVSPVSGCDALHFVQLKICLSSLLRPAFPC
jgi:hypothetical protein